MSDIPVKKYPVDDGRPYDCGACHFWGFNPPMNNGVCEICERTEEEIMKSHHQFMLTVEERAERRRNCGWDFYNITTGKIDEPS